MSEKYPHYTGDKFVWVEQEAIKWISVSDALPDAGTEVLICYERSDCEEREVTIASYDDEYDDAGPWYALSVRLFAGAVIYWADMPAGPNRGERVTTHPHPTHHL